MNIRNSFAIISYVFRMSANKLSTVRKVYERIAKIGWLILATIESYETVTNSLRKVCETIRNTLVTFS